MTDNIARQSITLAMQITERAASIVATEVNAVTNLLQAVADYDNSAEKLLEYQKEGYGKLNYNLCDKAYSGDFEQKLKQEGVVYYKLQNTRNPNYDIYVYPDCYSNRVTDIVKDHMIQNGMVNVVGKDNLSTKSIALLYFFEIKGSESFFPVVGLGMSKPEYFKSVA